MSFANVYCRANKGMRSHQVTVEAHLSRGTPKFAIVGLPETVVKESKDRVKCAIQNAGFEFPPGAYTVNLSPANIPKAGGRFDLPIALGILAATRQIPQSCLDDYEFAGELTLSADILPIPDCLPLAIGTSKSKRKLVISHENRDDAALIKPLEIIPAKNLSEVCSHLLGMNQIKPYVSDIKIIPPTYPDLADVRGQHDSKRALEIAAAGAHNMLMTGPPGSGKSMLANRLPGILPELTKPEAIEAGTVLSISNQGFNATKWRRRPFRAPHHSASSVALVGGGSPPRPGEITLAHLGVLFLDELPEYDRHVLESLREPLESGNITISRAAEQVNFPANFQFIAAMNPCPCGYQGDKENTCHCTPERVIRYQQKISGPLLDRIDLHVRVRRLPTVELTKKNPIPEESSQTVKDRVIKAHDRQLARQDCLNSNLSAKAIGNYCNLADKDQDFLTDALNKLKLSARAYHRVLKVSRSIADLAGADNIERPHLCEALFYRKTNK